MERARTRGHVLWAAAFVVVAFACAGPAGAAPPGTQTVDRSATLQTTGQSMFGGGAATGPGDQSFTLFDESWNTQGSAGGVTHVSIPLGFDPTPSVPICDPFSDYGDFTSSGFGVVDDDDCTWVDATTADDNIVFDIGDFGASATAHTQGEIGMSIKLQGFDQGSLDVTYPINAHFSLPKADTFAPGDTVTIGTSMDVGAATVHTNFPSLQGLELDGTFGFHADASGRLCVFTCTQGSIFDLSIPNNNGYTGPATGKLFDFPIHGTGCFNFLVNFPLGFGPYPNARCNNNGYIEPPNVGLTSTLNPDGSIDASGSDTYAIVPVSAVTWAGRLAGLGPIPLNLGPVTIPGTDVTVGWTSANLIFTALETMRQHLTFHPRVDVTLSWGENAAWVVRDGGGSVVASGAGTSATFPLGDRLELTTPTDLTGAMTLTPTFSMGGANVTNQITNTTAGSGDFRALSFTLKTPEEKQHLDYLGDVTVWPGTSIDAGPLVDKPFPLGSHDNTVADSSFTVGGFNAPAVAPLALVPDLPPAATPAAIAPTEGASFTGTVATFADPDQADAAKIASGEYSATIDWGDGTSTTGTITGTNARFSVAGTHTYAEEGPYAVTVTVVDADTPTVKAAVHSTANVADAALHAKGAATTTASDGTPILLGPAPSVSGTIATFTDDDPLGTLSDYTATIDWGDGATSAGTVSATAAGFAVSGSHVYARSGLYPVHTTVVDAGGSRSTSLTTVLLYGYADGGTFVLGKANAVLGRSVTFWGAQWAKTNTVTGAPAAFKGFADSPAGLSVCAGTWSSAGGSSSNPPAALPAYLAVAASTSVAKSGSGIAGDAPALVVVRVDPGYAPSAGHAGTGTVVASICGG